MYNSYTDFFDEDKIIPNPDNIEKLKRLYPNKYPYLEIISTDIYGNPEEVIMNPYPWLEPCFEVPGFWYIPGTNYNYAINEYGIIYSTFRDKELAVRTMKRNYKSISFDYIDRSHIQMLRHRIVAACFIPDHRHLPSLQVNHIDCMPGNDHVSNLEWLTPKENVRHYYYTKNDRNWIPIEAKNVFNGVIQVFENLVIAAEFFNRNTDWIEYVLTFPETRVWEGAWQIRKYDPSRPPFIQLTEEEINLSIYSAGTSNKIDLRNCLTGEVLHFERQIDCCNYLNLSAPALSSWINNTNQTVFYWNNGIWQVKNNPNLDWALIDDPYLQLSREQQFEPVKVIHPDGKFEIYLQAAECAKAHGLPRTTLNERLKVNNPNKFWKDGKAYVRYINYPGY